MENQQMSKPSNRCKFELMVPIRPDADLNNPAHFRVLKPGESAPRFVELGFLLNLVRLMADLGRVEKSPALENMLEGLLAKEVKKTMSQFQPVQVEEPTILQKPRTSSKGKKSGPKKKEL
jgi:hypothetical protein